MALGCYFSDTKPPVRRWAAHDEVDRQHSEEGRSMSRLDSRSMPRTAGACRGKPEHTEERDGVELRGDVVADGGGHPAVISPWSTWRGAEPSAWSQWWQRSGPGSVDTVVGSRVTSVTDTPSQTDTVFRSRVTSVIDTPSQTDPSGQRQPSWREQLVIPVNSQLLSRMGIWKTNDQNNEKQH